MVIYNVADIRDFLLCCNRAWLEVDKVKIQWGNTNYWVKVYHNDAICSCCGVLVWIANWLGHEAVRIEGFADLLVKVEVQMLDEGATLNQLYDCSATRWRWHLARHDLNWTTDGAHYNPDWQYETHATIPLITALQDRQESGARFHVQLFDTEDFCRMHTPRKRVTFQAFYTWPEASETWYDDACVEPYYNRARGF